MLQRQPRHTPFPYTTLFRSPPTRPRSSFVSTGTPNGFSCENLAGIATTSSLPHLRLDPKNAYIAFGLARSEEHTSELQSPVHLVCRLLLEKKNKIRFANMEP